VSENVVPLVRPPVRQATVVQAGIDETFEFFVGRLAEWWPLDPFSYGGRERISRLELERRSGGTVIEYWHDGTRHEWGTLLDWDPPFGFTMTWNITGHPTEVELRFTDEDSSGTRVEVMHRGWDKLTPEELTAACALPGGYAGGAFNTGWARILASLTSAIAVIRSEQG
jgi:hypothetical protein